MMTLPSSPNPPVSPSALPSPPTSPTTATAARTRVKVPRIRPRSLGNVPAPTSSEGERTKNVSFSLSKIVSADPGTPGSENRTIAPAAARRVVAGKRRKPSITYYTPSSPSPWSQRPQMHRMSSSSVDIPRDAEVVMANGEENVSQRSSLVLGPRSSPTRESVCSADGVGAREREPLTLVEKHADLLHLIAQKERKCLEVRDQLAVHEKDLAELKRKWGRIVNRGYDPLLNPPLAAGLGGVALDGLKESVRIIAAGFSDLGGPIQELDSSDEKTFKAQSLTHSPCGRNNTLNAGAKRAGSEHLSTSPTPPIQEGTRASDQALEGQEGEIMATAPSLSRAGSLNRRMHKRASRILAEEPTMPSSTFVSSPKKPKPADLGMSLILAPSSVWVQPPPENAKPASARPILKSAVLGSAWTAVPMNAGPVSFWMDSMGKKLSELQNGQTFSKGQKRASLLFAGVSNTITSALSPGPTPTTPAPAPLQISTSTPTTTPRTRLSTMPPSTSPASTKSSLVTVSPSPQPQPHLQSRSHPSCKTAMDWFEDDEEQQTGGVLLIPDSKQQHASMRATDVAIEGGETVTAAAAMSTFDDDDWNW